MDKNNFAARLPLIVAVALFAGCGGKPLDSNQTGAGGVTGTGGFTETGGVRGAGGSIEVAVVGDWYPFGDGVGPNAGIGDAGIDDTDSECVKNGGFSPESCTQITDPAGPAVPPHRPGVEQVLHQRHRRAGHQQERHARLRRPLGRRDWPQLRSRGRRRHGRVCRPRRLYRDRLRLQRRPGPASIDAGRLPLPGPARLDAPYWQGAIRQACPLTGTTASPQHVEIRWADIGGPST